MKQSQPTNVQKEKGRQTLSSLMQLLTGAHGRPAAFLLLFCLTIFFILCDSTLPHGFRNFSFDTYQRLFPREISRFPVAIVDIDEASLAGLGRWPWPRSLLADLTSRTHKLGAKAIGFDIIMPEPDSLSPDTLLSGRHDLPPGVRGELSLLPSNDQLLSRVLEQTPSVVARAGVRANGSQREKVRQTPVLFRGTFSLDQLLSYPDHLVNIALIEQAASGVGYLNDSRDPDGTVRTMPLVLKVKGKPVPSLAVEMLRTALGADWYTLVGDENGLSGVALHDLLLPTDSKGNIRLYYSPAYAGRRISALSVLQGEVADDFFKDQVVVIGVSGVGIEDVAPTPVSAGMEGVEIQAQLIENILANTGLIRPEWGGFVEIFLFFLLAVLLITLAPEFHPGYGIAGYLACCLGLMVFCLFFFLEKQTLYDPMLPVAGNGVILVVLMSGGLAASNRKKRQLDGALRQERFERQRMKGELQAAREIQMGLLPDPAAIDDLPACLDFHALLEPAYEVGGDWYDAFMIDERHFFFMVGDVAGKGVASSLFMALSKTLCKSSALRCGMMQMDDLIGQVNSEISRDNQAMLFVTAVSGILDVESGEVQLCVAGHDAPLLLRQGEVEQLSLEAGPPLCVMEEYDYPMSTLVLQPGDTLVLVSDGVTEAQDENEQLYTMTRVLECLSSPLKPRVTAREHCRWLFRDVRDFSRKARQADDITILAIRYV